MTNGQNRKSKTQDNDHSTEAKKQKYTHKNLTQKAVLKAVPLGPQK